MKIEFLKDGSLDCPLIILYGDSRIDYQNLSNAVKAIVAGQIKSLYVNDIDNFSSSDETSLEFKLSSNDIGIKTNNNLFVLELTKTSWEKVLNLIEPFIKSDKISGYQWLNETSDISLLISQKKEW